MGGPSPRYPWPQSCSLALRGLRLSHLTLGLGLDPKLDNLWVEHRELQS